MLLWVWIPHPVQAGAPPFFMYDKDCRLGRCSSCVTPPRCPIEWSEDNHKWLEWQTVVRGVTIDKESGEPKERTQLELLPMYGTRTRFMERLIEMEAAYNAHIWQDEYQYGRAHPKRPRFVPNGGGGCRFDPFHGHDADFVSAMQSCRPKTFRRTERREGGVCL